MDFGAGRGQGNGGPRLVLNWLSHLRAGSQEPAMKKKLEMYDLGHGPLYDPIFKMKDAHVADDTGTQCGNDPYSCSSTRSKRRATWNFELPGKGSFKVDDEMVAGLKAGYDKLEEHGWLNWFSCQPQVNTCIPKMGEYRQLSPAARPTSTPSSAPAPIGNPPSTRSTPPTPAACPSTAATSTRIGRPNASSSSMTRPGTTCRVPRIGRPWAPAIAEKAENRIRPCSTCPRRWADSDQADRLRLLPGMNDPMMHLMGYTPESPTLEAAFKGKMPKNPERFTVTMDDIVEMFRHINNIAPALRPGQSETGGHRHLRLSARDL